MDKSFFKEINRKNEKCTEDMLMQLLKVTRKTFNCDIWQESLADESILTEDARSGDSTAQFLLAMYWLLKSADKYYPAAVKTTGLFYEALQKCEDEGISYEKSYAKLQMDTAKYLRERGIDSEIAEMLEIEASGSQDRLEQEE